MHPEMATYLDRGDEFTIQVEVNVGEIWGRPSVDHHLVQHQLVCGRLYTTSLLFFLRVIVKYQNSKIMLISPSSECTANGIVG